MAEQLGFTLPVRAALGRDDFFVSPANALALALIDDWQNWPERKLVLSGPQASGKTHLTHVWADMTGAQIVPAGVLSDDMVPELVDGPVAVEDIDTLATTPDGQTALFHLHNLMRAQGQPLLLSGTGEVAHWSLTLPDLISRLQAATVARLDAPDDALLSALLIKLLADRQLTPGPKLVPFLLKRMDRSFAAAADLIDRLDAASLAQKKPITPKLAASLLDIPAR